MDTWKVVALIVLGLTVSYFLFFRGLPFIRVKIFNKATRGGILTISIITELLIIFFPLVFLQVVHMGQWETLMVAMWALVVVLVPFGLIYFWWAPNNLYFTFVDEGTAKFVIKGGAHHKTLLQLQNHVLSPAGDVVPGLPKKRLFGSLHYYGLWPILDVWIYNFQWISQESSGEVTVHPKRLIDYILVKPDVYVIFVKNAETLDALPVTAKMFLTVKVVNPYKAVFKIQNWLEAVTNRCIPIVADKLREKTYDEWRACPGNLADEILRDRDTKRLLKFFVNEWGVEVSAMEIAEIDPPDEFRKATLEKFTGTRSAERMIAETAELYVAMMANVRGVDLAQVRSEIKTDPTQREAAEGFIREMSKIKIAGSNLKMFESKGDAVINCAAILGSFLGGKGGGANTP